MAGGTWVAGIRRLYKGDTVSGSVDPSDQNGYIVIGYNGRYISGPADGGYIRGRVFGPWLIVYLKGPSTRENPGVSKFSVIAIEEYDTETLRAGGMPGTLSITMGPFTGYYRPSGGRYELSATLYRILPKPSGDGTVPEPEPTPEPAPGPLPFPLPVPIPDFTIIDQIIQYFTQIPVIGPYLVALVRWIVSMFTAVWSYLTSLVQTVTMIVQNLNNVLYWINNTFQEIINNVNTTINNISNNVTNLINETVNNIQNVVNQIYQTVQNIEQTVIQTVSMTGAEIFNLVRSYFEAAYQILSETPGSIWEYIINGPFQEWFNGFMEFLPNFIASTIQNMIGWLITQIFQAFDLMWDSFEGSFSWLMGKLLQLLINSIGSFIGLLWSLIEAIVKTVQIPGKK